jgi:N-acetylmuramoyl-L-alanine amidase
VRKVLCAIACMAAVASAADSAAAQKTADFQRMASGGPASPARAAKPLAGTVVVIDPGHQLGNATHPRKINRLANAGGFLKACNTTGTSTNGGFPESTFAWRVAQALRHQLRRRGATVYRTRHTNSYADWGPCIDVRGRRGNSVHADAVVSVHGDGADPGVRGFFVIRPADRRRWTSDIFRSSRRLALKVRRGLLSAGARVSNAYGGDGLDVRGDLGTLNWSDVPAVMVELGNMRNATDAHHMTSRHYRDAVYARGLRRGLTKFVRHR